MGPEQEINVQPVVGDAELQHWIDQARINAEKAVIAGKASASAKVIARQAANMAISAAQQLLRDADQGLFDKVVQEAAPNPATLAATIRAASAAALAAHGTSHLGSLEDRWQCHAGSIVRKRRTAESRRTAWVGFLAATADTRAAMH